MKHETVALIRKVVLLAAGTGFAWMYAASMLNFNSELSARVGSFFTPWILASFVIVAYEGKLITPATLVDLGVTSFAALLQPIIYMHVYLRVLDFIGMVVMPDYSYADMLRIMFFIAGSLFIVVAGQLVCGWILGQSEKMFK